MPFTILHISDLHRSPDDLVKNLPLLASLDADIDHWAQESERIPRPDAVVVSGDLVRGVRVGTADFERELDRQYADALDFLVGLADDVVGCDRSQVILVPGNHDVDWNGAFNAMEEVPSADLGEDLRLSSFGPEADLRWNWRERTVFRIINRDLYEDRFRRFYELCDAFYGNPVVRGAYFSTHELAQGRIGVAAFNSCSGNDCFAFHGAIPDHALAGAYRELRGHGHDLLMGIWHHNVEGPPYTTDYMDVSVIHRLIGNGFTLGLHGHQHRSQLSVRYVHLAEQEQMALISAGSLCAGARELPTGVNRQYNVVVLDDDLRRAVVHVREIAVADVWAPARRTEFGGKSSIEMTVSLRPVTLDPRPLAPVLDAEAALQAGDFQQVVDLLGLLETQADSYEESLLVEAIQRGRMWADAMRLFSPPRSPGQLVLTAHGAMESGEFQQARALLDQFSARVNLPTNIANEIRHRIRVKEELKREP